MTAFYLDIRGEFSCLCRFSERNNKQPLRQEIWTDLQEKV